MNNRSLLFFIGICLLTCSQIISQTATLKGIVLDASKIPIEGANVSYKNNGTQTNKNGVYILEIPANTEISVTFSYIGYKNTSIKIKLEENQEYELNPILKTEIEQITTVVISGKERKEVQGITILDPETIRNTPSANAGVEGLLKTLPGVSSNNELSTQYTVRGGNYDENLIYVNEIEVYRPFLIRSGQQEGLSFVNTDLVRNVDFSAGGFQAKYGDKLSSVLDISYRRPTRFGATAEASFLGGSVSLEGITKDKKLAVIGGARYRDNSLFVNGRQTQTDYTQKFIDAQTYISYSLSKKFELGFLGNIAINNYNNRPLTRQTNFGTIQDSKALLVFYEGQEEDQYATYFGALKGTYQVNENLTLKLIGSAYHTQEQEYFDILAQYRIGEPNTSIGDENLGEVEFSQGVGSQLTHARNDLDALIFNIEQKGTYVKDDHQLDWGVKYTQEDIIDRIQEFEIVDLFGISDRPNLPDFVNNQPYEPFASPIVPFTNVNATNNVTIDRFSGYVQYSKRSDWGASEVWYNFGVRNHNWTLTGDKLNSISQHFLTPRGQFAIKPGWKKDMLFRLSGGYYYQPPFYRELRDLNGTVQPKVRSQKSIHFVAGHDWSLTLWDRPFKLITEAYYKSLNDLNPYTIENVRIRYRARNNGIGRSYGLDMRLNGEFVPGTESWISFGYLKAEQNISNRGWIPLPTDQRLKFGILFQDYVPKLPNLKGYLNLVYNTGLPGGSPSNADIYDFAKTRLPDYKRADLGVSYILVDQNKRFSKGHIFHNFKELSLGFEIYNMFDVKNSITNIFVRDAVSQRQFAIPNFLTPRLFNLRMKMRL